MVSVLVTVSRLELKMFSMERRLECCRSVSCDVYVV